MGATRRGFVAVFVILVAAVSCSSPATKPSTPGNATPALAKEIRDAARRYALAELNGDAAAMLTGVCIECGEDLAAVRARTDAQAAGVRLTRAVEKRWGVEGRAEMWDIPRERLHTAAQRARAINRGYDDARVDVEGDNARVMAFIDLDDGLLTETIYLKRCADGIGQWKLVPRSALRNLRSDQYAKYEAQWKEETARDNRIADGIESGQIKTISEAKAMLPR